MPALLYWLAGPEHLHDIKCPVLYFWQYAAQKNSKRMVNLSKKYSKTAQAGLGTDVQ